MGAQAPAIDTPPIESTGLGCTAEPSLAVGPRSEQLGVGMSPSTLKAKKNEKNSHPAMNERGPNKTTGWLVGGQAGTQAGIQRHQALNDRLIARLTEHQHSTAVADICPYSTKPNMPTMKVAAAPKATKAMRKAMKTIKKAAKK